jgi:hypothetical protein
MPGLTLKLTAAAGPHAQRRIQLAMKLLRGLAGIGVEILRRPGESAESVPDAAAPANGTNGHAPEPAPVLTERSAELSGLAGPPPPAVGEVPAPPDAAPAPEPTPPPAEEAPPC